MLSLLLSLFVQLVPAPAAPPTQLPLEGFQQLCQELHTQASASLTRVEFSTPDGLVTASGVIIDNDGHLIVPSVVSMAQLEEGIASINVVRADDKSFSAVLVAENRHYSFSLLHAPQLKGLGAKPLSALTPLAPGTVSFTFSNFLGSMPALNQSIISANSFQYGNCVLQPLGDRLANDDTGMVMNLDGELIGIIWPDFGVLELQQLSMSFFVPIEVVFDLFRQLNPPWLPPRILGVLVDQELRSEQMPNSECCWRLTVSAVADGSVADVANITPGDVLVSINSIPLMSAMHLRMALQKSPATTHLVVLRDGKEIALKLSFAEDKSQY
jgi:S1-C subfamily serine protease